MGCRARTLRTAARRLSGSMAARVRAIIPSEIGAERRSDAMIKSSSTEKRRSRTRSADPALASPVANSPNEWDSSDPDGGCGSGGTTDSGSDVGRRIARESMLTPSFGLPARPARKTAQR